MNKTRQIIINNEEKFPQFAEYYIDILDQIEKNLEKMPDVSIECCKSLIEGVSKCILKYQNKPYESSSRTGGTPQKFLKNALESLGDSVDQEFIQSTANFVKRIAELRNERGDVSHGKAAPKEIVSDVYLAESIIQTTDGLVYYLLSVFYGVDWSRLQETNYDDNEDYNKFLDTENSLDDVSYSKALFDQDPVAYRTRLEDYKALQNE